MDRPETRYVAVGDADVAYQVFGSGPPDLLYAGGMGSHIEVYWEWPPFAEQMRRLASFGRVILFDRRGAGLSDSVSLKALPTWEEWAEDMTAVLDAAWSSRAAVLAWLDAGPPAMLFAAMHPERVSALVLINTAARTLQASDYPIGLPNDAVDTLRSFVRKEWGTADFASIGTPGVRRDPEWVRFLATVQRASMTPRTAAAQFDYVVRTSDVRWALPLVQVPTLILQCEHNPVVPLGLGRYLAEHIPNSRLVELPGAELGPSAPNNERIVTHEVTRFLTGEQPSVDIERLLTTVLFTDIVSSTERASGLGDRRWTELLEQHDAIIDAELSRHRGRKVHTTGDGVFATFDGPARAIRCAMAIRDSLRNLGLQIRSGLHTGECELRGEDIGGIAVHTAARVSALAGPEEILVSRTVVDLVAGSDLEFSDRGDHALKGVPGTWKLFSVKG